MSGEIPIPEPFISDDDFREILKRYGEIPESLIELRVGTTDQEQRRKWAEWDEKQRIQKLESNDRCLNP